jgi:tetratricopeptide (TPR) repeat protein
VADEAGEPAGERWDAGDMESVVMLCTAKLEHDPDSSGALGTRGAARAALGDLEGAIADLSRSIELAPDQPWTWAVRGDVQDRAGRGAEAMADLTRAIEVDPDNAWTRARRFQIAAKGLGLDEVLSPDPEEGGKPDFRRWIGRLMMDPTLTGELGTALEDLQRAMQLDAETAMFVLSGAPAPEGADDLIGTMGWLREHRDGDLEEILAEAQAAAGRPHALATFLSLGAALGLRVAVGVPGAPEARAALAALAIAEIDRQAAAGATGLEPVREWFEVYL